MIHGATQASRLGGIGQVPIPPSANLSDRPSSAVTSAIAMVDTQLERIARVIQRVHQIADDVTGVAPADKEAGPNPPMQSLQGRIELLGYCISMLERAVGRLDNI